MVEDLPAAVCVFVPRGRVSFDHSSHVRLFYLALIGDFYFVESPSGIGTELPWQLRCAYGPPTLHSLSTVSQHRPHTI